MARSSDIDLAKLALIFEFAEKEKIYGAVREVALLHELEVNKNLAHIVYERHILTIEQIQSLYWALLRSGRIRRFPSRIVYEFTEEDDQQFLEKSMLPFEEVLKAVRETQGKKVENMTGILQESFPQEPLIYCLDIQKQLAKKEVDRPLLSILNAKGYLDQKSHQHLLPVMENKKVVLCSPQDAQSAKFRDRCESFLFAAVAKKQKVIDEKQANYAMEIWGKVRNRYKLDIRYSEVVYYLGYADKSTLNKLGIFLEELINIRQTPRYNMISLGVEETKAFQELVEKPEYQEKYKTAVETASELKEIGLDLLEAEQIMLHQKIIHRDKLLPKPSEKSQEYKKYEQLLKKTSRTNLLDSSKESQKLWREKERHKLIKSMIPFSVRDLDKEIQGWYRDERRAARRKTKAHEEFDRLVHEWSQTQVAPLSEIEFSPTEDMSLRGTSPLPKLRLSTVTYRKREDAKVVEDGDQTEYISLDDPQEREAKSIDSKKKFSGPVQYTEYFALDASRAEMKMLRSRIAEKVGELRSQRILFWSIFMLSLGTALAGMILDETTALGIPLSMFAFFAPLALLGKFIGSRLDEGNIHRVLYKGFLAYSVPMLLLALSSNIVWHLLLRLIQGIGGAAIFVALFFCISRWFGSVERGRVLGLGMSIYTCGFTLGILFPNMAALTGEGVQSKAVSILCVIWGVLGLLTVPFASRLRIKQVVSEDSEEEEERLLSLGRKPLISASLYGFVVMGLIGIFFPAVSSYTNWEISPQNLIVSLMAGTLLGSFVLGRIGDRIGPVPVLRFLSAVAIICFVMIPFDLTGTWARPLFFCIGLVLGGLTPLGFSWFLEIVDDARYFGLACGAFSIWQSVGFVIGCLLCGSAYYFYGVTIPFLRVFFLALTMAFIPYLYLLLITPTGYFMDYRSRKFRGMLSLLEPSSE